MDANPDNYVKVPPKEAMPPTLLAFVLRMGRSHQLALAAISVLLFLAGTAPLEIQRRVINAATQGAPYPTIFALVLAYLGLVLLEGLTKLGLNLYRGWIGEVAIRWLRMTVLSSSDQSRWQRVCSYRSFWPRRSRSAALSARVFPSRFYRLAFSVRSEVT